MEPDRHVPSYEELQSTYPELSRFLTGYFHEDWDMEAPDDRGLVRKFLSEWKDDDAAQVLRELDAFLASTPDSVLGDVLLYGFTVRYDPAFFGFTSRQWLERIRGFLAAG